MRRHWGITGLDPVSNYDTVSIGLNGLVSAKVWNEVHAPSSKALSIRMLTSHAMKSAWNTSKKHEMKEFEDLQEFRMAVVALDTAIRKVMAWNESFATVAIFLQSVNFGENDLSGKADKLVFLADFVDEIIKYNAQAWDEERHFMSAQEVSAKWSSLFIWKFAAAPGAAKGSRRAGG